MSEFDNLTEEQRKQLEAILSQVQEQEEDDENELTDYTNENEPETVEFTEVTDVREFVVIPLEQIRVPSGRQRKNLGDLQELKDSISIFGVRTPIQVLSKGNGKFDLIAGERRFRSCQQLGMAGIPAIIETETEALVEAHEAIENLHRKALDWHEEVEAREKLHNILAAINPNHTQEATAKALKVSTGTVSMDLNLAQALRENPELKKLKTKKQAMNELVKEKLDEAITELTLRRAKTDYGKKAAGNLFFGDAMELIKKIPDASIDVILTDPPYGIEISSMKRNNTYGEIYVDSKDDYLNLMSVMLPEFHRVVKQNGWVVIFFGIQYYEWIKTRLDSLGFITNIVPGIWDRGSGQCMQPSYSFASTYEPFFYSRVGEATLLKQGQSPILKFPGVPTVNKEHPVEKPVELMDELLQRFALTGSKVLDPFAGSAVTLEACIKRGCIPIGFEKDEKFYRSGIARLARAIQLKDSGLTEGIKSM